MDPVFESVASNAEDALPSINGRVARLLERDPGTNDVEVHELGASEEGRPITGVVVGKGRRRASLVAGAHSDEPVGPYTLLLLLEHLFDAPDRAGTLLEDWTLVIVPHINPDGEERNRPWREEWPDVAAYVGGAFREPPGRDVEFGYPDMRPENQVVARFLRAQGPFDLHMSLHGMGFSEGAMLLIERRWGYRTQHLQREFVAAAAGAGLPLHDQNRQGEKGFFYLGPGFWTTPEGGGTASALIGQSYRINSDDVLPDSVGGDREFSDIYFAAIAAAAFR